jgi:hypothetical protein
MAKANKNKTKTKTHTFPATAKTVSQALPVTLAAKATKAAKPTKTAKVNAKPKKMSALDAAAKVLGEKGTSMTTGELVEAMAKKGYWSSPNGLTPAATLYAAILREINAKGKESRFTKTEPGQFALQR